MKLPRNAQLWLPGYIRHTVECQLSRQPEHGPVDVLFCIADHYEPGHGTPGIEVERARVSRWVRNYPRLARFSDSDGRPPQHTFFYPADQYRPEHLDALSQLCRGGFGEVEIHLHHDDDTSENLRQTLLSFASCLHERHGLLGRDEQNRVAYGFIHGNWALDNSRPDGRWCGVNDELTILRETGCYADFTQPAAPDPCQTKTVNSIYYAVDDPDCARSHEYGTAARVGAAPPTDSLLLLQGPLTLNWKRRRGWVLPRVENGQIDRATPPSVERFADWVKTRVTVKGRPEWVFVKVHTHGAPEPNADVLLGPAAVAFHAGIGREFNDNNRFRLHYVTAREMANIVRAAEDGRTGNPSRYRDYRVRSAIRSTPVEHTAVSA